VFEYKRSQTESIAIEGVKKKVKVGNKHEIREQQQQRDDDDDDGAFLPSFSGFATGKDCFKQRRRRRLTD
jgi:hypothetical protein